MEISGKRREWGNSYIVSKSSNKKFSERIRCGGRYKKEDGSHKMIYQLSADGKIVKNWESVGKIAEHFNTYDSKIRYHIDDQRIVGGFLYVKMFEYKSSIDYPILFKYLKYKGKVKESF